MVLSIHTYFILIQNSSLEIISIFLGRQSSRSVSNDNQKPSPEQQQQQPKQEIKEVCQKLSLDQLIDSQLNNLTQLLPFNWSLTDPSLFSNANEYQKLLEDCQDSGTVIHALTGCPFNFTKETIHSKIKFPKVNNCRKIAIFGAEKRQYFWTDIIIFFPCSRSWCYSR